LLLTAAMVFAACTGAPAPSAPAEAPAAEAPAEAPAEEPAEEATEAPAEEPAVAEGVCAPATDGELAGVDPSGQTVVWWTNHSGSRGERLNEIVAQFNAENE